MRSHGEPASYSVINANDSSQPPLSSEMVDDANCNVRARSHVYLPVCLCATACTRARWSHTRLNYWSSDGMMAPED